MKKSISKMGALLLAATLAIGSLGGCKSTTASVATASHPQTVQIAILTGMAPYTYVDNSGQMQGYDYEFLKMCDDLLPEYQFHYNAVDPNAAAAAVKAGTYALSASAHFVTPARQKNYLLTKPECYFPVNLISRKTDHFTKFADLNGKRLVPDPPNDGLYVVLHNLEAKYPNVKPVEQEVSDYVPYDQSCKDVSNGTYDCWFGGDTMFDDVMKKDPMDNLYCSDPIACAPCVVVINKKYTDLRDKLNQCISKLYSNGSLSNLSQKWLGKDVFSIAKETGSLEKY